MSDNADDNSASFYQLTERYPDEASAIRYFEEKRWPKGAHCRQCGSVDVFKGNANRRLPLWSCRDCGHQFTVTSGTVMEGTKLPLRKWLWPAHYRTRLRRSPKPTAFHLVTNSKAADFERTSEVGTLYANFSRQ